MFILTTRTLFVELLLTIVPFRFVDDDDVAVLELV